MNKEPIKTVIEFLNAIQGLENQLIAQWFFRGHCNEEFRLTPSLFRLDNSETFSDWKKLGSYMLESFKREALPHLSIIPKSEEDWLTLAQHHRLPTRLLDWTTNPLVALYFAIEKPSENDFSHVWCYGVASTNNCFPVSSLIARRINTEISSYILLPQHLSPRITAQSGCFSIHDYPNGDAPFIPFNEQAMTNYNEFAKINIREQDKTNILNELYLLGIHEGFLFPGLEGIAQKIRFELTTRHQRNTNDEEISAIHKSDHDN